MFFMAPCSPHPFRTPGHLHCREDFVHIQEPPLLRIHLRSQTPGLCHPDDLIESRIAPATPFVGSLRSSRSPTTSLGAPARFDGLPGAVAFFFCFPRVVGPSRWKGRGGNCSCCSGGGSFPAWVPTGLPSELDRMIDNVHNKIRLPDNLLF